MTSLFLIYTIRQESIRPPGHISVAVNSRHVGGFVLVLKCFQTLASTPPVLDCLNSVQHLQDRGLEDSFLSQKKKGKKGTAD